MPLLLSTRLTTVSREVKGALASVTSARLQQFASPGPMSPNRRIQPVWKDFGGLNRGNRLSVC